MPFLNTEDLQSLQDSAFSALSDSRAAQDGVRLTSAFKSTTVLNLIPASTPEKIRQFICAIWMTCLKSVDTDIELWNSLLLSLSVALLPDSQKLIAAKAIQIREISHTEITAIVEYRDNLIELSSVLPELNGENIVTDQGVLLYEGLPTELKEKFKGYEQAAQSVPIPASFPEENRAPVGLWLFTATKTEVLYGVYSLIAFLAGKTITEENKSAIESRRPAAIENKYGCKNSELLTGKFKMSRQAHEGFNRSWTILAEFRKNMFDSFTTFSHQESDLGLSVIWTTVKLMEYAGMQHTQLIHSLLRTYPWVINVPALRSSVQAYIVSLKEFVKIPPHLRPYYKVMHGDKSTLFQRKHMEPLIAVAVHHLADNRPEIANYYTATGSKAVIAAFERYKDNVQIHTEEGV